MCQTMDPQTLARRATRRVLLGVPLAPAVVTLRAGAGKVFRASQIRQPARAFGQTVPYAAGCRGARKCLRGRTGQASPTATPSTSASGPTTTPGTTTAGTQRHPRRHLARYRPQRPRFDSTTARPKACLAPLLLARANGARASGRRQPRSRTLGLRPSSLLRPTGLLRGGVPPSPPPYPGGKPPDPRGVGRCPTARKRATSWISAVALRLDSI